MTGFPFFEDIFGFVKEFEIVEEEAFPFVLVLEVEFKIDCGEDSVCWS